MVDLLYKVNKTKRGSRLKNCLAEFKSLLQKSVMSGMSVYCCWKYNMIVRQWTMQPMVIFTCREYFKYFEIKVITAIIKSLMKQRLVINNSQV